VKICSNEGYDVDVSIINKAIFILVKYTCRLIDILRIDNCTVGMYGVYFKIVHELLYRTNHILHIYWRGD